MATSAASIVQERERILIRLTEYFRQRRGTVGLYLGGSVADGTADAWSDLDVRVVVGDEHLGEFCAERLTAPENWGQLLFNTGAMGEHMCVSHFAPMVKVDLFYYRAHELKPSPWIARGVRVLLDDRGVVRDLVARSSGLTFRAEISEVNRLINNVFASAHEVVRRVQRGELAYAQSILGEIRWYLAIGHAYLHDKAPMALAHFEGECDDPELRRAIAESYPAYDAVSILIALNRLVPVLGKQIAALGERFELGRSGERDAMSLSAVEGWQLVAPT